MQRTIFLCATVLLFSISACKKTPVTITNELDASHLDVQKVLNLPFITPSYTLTVPKYLQALGVTAPDIDKNKATLGRVLFYDKSLSRDGSVSCASCHRPENAFADPARFSAGVAGKTTSRNSPGLSTVVHVGAHYSGLNPDIAPFFWDMRASTIAEQSRQTLQNPHEMDMDFATLLQRVRNQKYYQALFTSAYDTEEIAENQVLECLEEFVSALAAGKTRFDFGMEASADNLLRDGGLISDTIPGFDTVFIRVVYYGVDSVPTVTGALQPHLKVLGLTGEEQRGAATFVSNCSECHSPIRPFQQVFSANIGLDLNYTDQGLGALTGKTSDMGVFKAPPLRNIALTAPYMHDGRFQTLEEVVEFYNSGIKPHPNLHPTLKSANGQPKRFNFTASQKKELVAFLHTLTDNSLAHDARFTNPFK